jgi:hypothetical protein
MERTGVNLLILPDREAQKNPWEILKRLDLGPTERQISDPTPPAVGFVTGLGPVLVQNHEVFFWPDIANAAKHQPVEAKMADFNNEAPRRYEISGGAIQASQFGPGRRPMIARLDFQALTDPTGQRKRAPYTFSNPEPFGPMPVFDNVSSIGRMARFQSFPEEHPSDDHRLIRDPAVEWSRDFDESEAVPIKITVHRTDEASEEHDVSLPVILTAKSPERIGRFGLAFVTGQ